jgi:hypothetical protein
MKKLIPLLLLAVCLGGCKKNPGYDSDARDAQYEEQLAKFNDLSKRYEAAVTKAEQLNKAYEEKYKLRDTQIGDRAKNYDEQIRAISESQTRIQDMINYLDEQGRRYDAILERMQQANPAPQAPNQNQNEQQN